MKLSPYQDAIEHPFDYEWREWKVLGLHSMSSGHKSFRTSCPFCHCLLVWYAWAGKKTCECGARLTRNHLAFKKVVTDAKATG
jgi:hypothetical protein